MTVKRTLLFLGVIIFIPLISYFALRLARGERFDFQTKTLNPTGLLVTTSTPEGASVFIDGKLKTATDDTLNLAPGEYEVEIKKDGFHPWKKQVVIEKEVVTTADPYLFSAFPSLKSLTFTGASHPVLSPDGQKIAFAVATDSASLTKRGLWVLDISARPLGFDHQPRQIIQSAAKGRDFSQADYLWSPDSEELLITLENRPDPQTKKVTTERFLLNTNRLNDPTQLIDVTPNLESILAQWETEIKLRQDAQTRKLPKKLLEVLGEAIDDLEFSPNDKKILYTATASATLPKGIVSPLPGTNTQPEERQLQPGKIYVYDLVEDKNFAITTQQSLGDSLLTWFPTSRHLFLVKENKVTILDYDNTNHVNAYTGPFEKNAAFPFPDAGKILILASLGENQPPNLYAVSLR